MGETERQATSARLLGTEGHRGVAVLGAIDSDHGISGLDGCGTHDVRSSPRPHRSPPAHSDHWAWATARKDVRHSIPPRAAVTKDIGASASGTTPARDLGAALEASPSLVRRSTS